MTVHPADDMPPIQPANNGPSEGPGRYGPHITPQSKAKLDGEWRRKLEEEREKRRKAMLQGHVGPFADGRSQCVDAGRAKREL